MWSGQTPTVKGHESLLPRVLGYESHVAHSAQVDLCKGKSTGLCTHILMSLHPGHHTPSLMTLEYQNT